MSTASVPLGVVARRQRLYFRFIMPALVVIGAVIIFPWLFTIWMSAFDWKIGTEAHFVGLDNYTGLVRNQRFLEAVVRPAGFTIQELWTDERDWFWVGFLVPS